MTFVPPVQAPQGFPQQAPVGSPAAGFTFNFNGIKPIEGGAEPIPGGIYLFQIVDTPVDMRGEYQVLTVHLKVTDDSPQNAEYNGRVVFDDWFLPNPAKQDQQQLEKTLGRLKAKIDALYGSDIDGDFTINPFDMIGKFIRVEVYVTADTVKENGQPVKNADGTVQKYPPKNRVSRWIRNDAAQQGPMTAAQPFIPQPISAPQPVAQQMQPIPQPGFAPPPVMVPQQMAPQMAPSMAPAPQVAPEMAPQAAPSAPQVPATAPQPGPVDGSLPVQGVTEQNNPPMAAQSPNGGTSETPGQEPTFKL